MSYKSGMSFKDIQTVTGTINLSSIYSTVLADASGGAVVLNLPAASAQAEIIFRIKAVDVTNSITITPSGVETIDGVAGSITMSTLNEIVTLQSTGSQWVSLENSFAKDNIYTADGTLTGDRTVTMGGNDIIFNGGQLLTDLGDYQNPSYSFENNRGSGLYSFGSNGVALTADSSYVLGFIHSSGVNTATIYGSGNNSVGAANLTITENSTALGSSENVRTSMFWSGGVFNIEAWESGVGYDKNISLNGLGGNVGIGTATPSSSLHVVGSTIFTSEDVLTIESNPNGTGEYIGMVFKNTDKDTNAAIRSVVGGNTDDADLAFIVDYQGTPFEGMRILGDSGHVGIGTTSPAYKLDVNGNARITGAIYDSNNQAGTSGQILSSTAIGTDWIDAISSADITGTANYLGMFDSDGVGLVDSLLFVEGSYLKYDSNFIIGQNNSTDATNKSSRWGVAHYTNSEKPILGIMGTCTGSSSYVYIGGGSSIGNAATAITFFTAATNTTNTGTQRMIINKDGDVGIGTGAPIAKTHIVGDGNSGTSRAMLIHNSDNDTILDVKDNGSFIVGAGGESDTAEGFWTRPDGRTSIVRDDNDTLILTRNTSDGNVISFRRDGGDVGAIGITTGGLTIGTPSSTAIETTSQNVKLTAYGLGTKEAADLTKTSSGYGAVFATDGTILEELGGASLANEGLSKDTTTGNIQLGHAASGTGASDFTSDRYLYTGAFDLEIGGAGDANIFTVDGSAGTVGIGEISTEAKLFVKGDGTDKTTTNFDLEDSAGTTLFKVFNNGGITNLASAQADFYTMRIKEAGSVTGTNAIRFENTIVGGQQTFEISSNAATTQLAILSDTQSQITTTDGVALHIQPSRDGGLVWGTNSTSQNTFEINRQAYTAVNGTSVPSHILQFNTIGQTTGGVSVTTTPKLYADFADLDGQIGQLNLMFDTVVLQADKDGTLVLNDYGLGTKEAVDLSKTDSGYFLKFATDGTIIESNSSSSASNGTSISGTDVVLGHAAQGTGLSDFTSNRYLYTDTFDLDIGTSGTTSALLIDGATGRIGMNTAVSASARLYVVDSTVGAIGALCSTGFATIEGSNSSSGTGIQGINTGNGAAGIFVAQGTSSGVIITKDHATTGKIPLQVSNNNSLTGYHPRNGIMALTGFGSGANTATPNTTQFSIDFQAGDSVGTTTDFARLTYEIVDNVSATKESALHFWTADGTGSLVDRLVLDGAGTLQGTAYGLGTKEAADLTKTSSGYIAEFATDGTILETTLSSVPLTLETITAATASLTKDNTLLDATSNAVDLQPNPANMTVGQRYIVKAINTTNAVTITPTSGTIDGQASYTLPAQYDGVIMITDGTNIYLA